MLGNTKTGKGITCQQTSHLDVLRTGRVQGLTQRVHQGSEGAEEQNEGDDACVEQSLSAQGVGQLQAHTRQQLNSAYTTSQCIWNQDAQAFGPDIYIRRPTNKQVHCEGNHFLIIGASN